MRRLLTVLVIMAVFPLGTTLHAEPGQKYASINLGAMIPSGDLADLDHDATYNWGFTYGSGLSRLVNVEMDVLHYVTNRNETINGNEIKESINTTGLETILVFQKQDTDIQPYGGIGFGFYYDQFDGTVNNTDRELDYSMGWGVVVKGGFRALIDDVLYAGMYAKKVMNRVTIDSRNPNTGDLQSKEYGLGSWLINVEIGVRFY